MKLSLILAGAIGLSLSAHAALTRQIVEYKTGAKAEPMAGVLIFDNASKAAQPGLVLVPNWMGINEANLKQAERIAGMGYVVFVADMYGKSVRPKNADEAGKASGAVKGDRLLMRQRAQAALNQLVLASSQAKAKLDGKNLGAIGFCFGGTTALELARDGAPVKGVVSFHGGLDSPQKYEASKVGASILVLHGADDPYVPAKEVDGFQTEMRTNKLDWELVSYGNAVHSFTDVDAKAKGQADYNEKVANRAYARMRDFFAGVFASK
jgi:dienelactone hydrolase